MKHITLCLCMCVGILYLSQAQFRKIPPEVSDAFEKKYPQATDASWSSRMDYFQVTFSLYGISFTADFTPMGGWQQSAQDVLADKLPRAVKKGLQKTRFADWDIAKAVFVVSKSDSIRYRIQVARSAIQFRYLFFTPEGNLEKEALTL